MRHRSTVALLALFFAGLGALWYVDQARIPTRDQQRVLLGRLFPELVDEPVSAIARLEVEQADAGSKIVVERRPGGQWQLRAPIDAAADPTLVETLVRNLKDLKKSPDSGTIEGDPARFQLDKPPYRLSLFGKEKTEPLARLDLGTRNRNNWYVRPSDSKGFEVVDARLLALLAQPVLEWRDRMLVRVPSFRVMDIAVHDADPARSVELRRDERHWRIVEPVQTAADDDRTEGLLAELGALRAADGTTGFVADGVTDLARYGLDKPAMSITITPFDSFGPARTIRIGKTLPDQPDMAYALRDDQDDVLAVSVKLLRESFGKGMNTLRSQRVGEFEPARVNRIRIDWRGQLFDLARTPRGWRRLSPSIEDADETSVVTLLARLDELRASEFLDAASVPAARLDPPDYRVRLWQPDPRRPTQAPSSGESTPAGELRLDLRLGRHDLVRRTVYGRVEGDQTILALTDGVLTSLPRNEYAYRNQAVVSFDLAQVESLTVERDGVPVTVRAPGSGSSGVNWRVVEPIEGAANDQAITTILLALSKLRAASWESTAVGDGAAFGLDHPRLRVRWRLRQGPQPAGPGGSTTVEHEPRTTTLRVGATRRGPEGAVVLANIEGEPGVFSLQESLVGLLEAELHDRKVLSIPTTQVQRLRFAWPHRSLVIQRGALTGPGQARGWAPALGFDATGFDYRRIEPLLKSLESLEVARFLQYAGPLPDSLGLNPPRLRLTIEHTGRGPETVETTLRLGSTRDGQIIATLADDRRGAVFLLPASENWAALAVPPARIGDLPDDPFVQPIPQP